jgi:hypothetical protein
MMLRFYISNRQNTTWSKRLRHTKPTKSGSKTILYKLPSKVNRKPSRVQEDGSGDSEADLPASYHSASLFHGSTLYRYECTISSLRHHAKFIFTFEMVKTFLVQVLELLVSRFLPLSIQPSHRTQARIPLTVLR